MSIQSRVEAAIQRMLYPVVKLLMEYGVSESDFSRLTRIMYVKVAAENIEGAPAGVGNKATATRIALATGIGRNNIKAILEGEASVIGQDEWYRHRCAAVLTDWHNTPEFIDQRGAPISIPFASDNGPSFESLVQVTAKSLSAHAVLEELKLVGAIEELALDENDPEGSTVLVAKKKIFRRFGSQIEDLESAMDGLYNLASSNYEIMMNGSESLKTNDRVFEADAATSHMLLNDFRKHADAAISNAERSHANHRPSKDGHQSVARTGIGVYVYSEDKMADSRFFTNVLTEDEDKKIANE